MRHVTLVLAAACAAAVPLRASAQFSRPDDAVRYRQGALNVMGAHFSRLGGMAQGKLPWDAKAVTENVAIVETLHTLPFAAFGPETSKSTSKVPRPVKCWSRLWPRGFATPMPTRWMALTARGFSRACWAMKAQG